MNTFTSCNLNPKLETLNPEPLSPKPKTLIPKPDNPRNLCFPKPLDLEMLEDRSVGQPRGENEDLGSEEVGKPEPRADSLASKAYTSKNRV